MLRHDRIVHAASAEQTAVNLWMQRLDASVHDFGKARVAGHFAHRYACLAQHARRATGRQDVDIAAREPASELEQAGLVRDGEEGASNGNEHGVPRDRIAAASCAAW